jgi:hypothetical protein
MDTAGNVATIAADAADAASVDAAGVNGAGTAVSAPSHADTILARQFSFRPGDIVKAGKVVVYDPRKETAQLLTEGETFQDELPQDKYVYYIIAPITRSGIAFLGDAGKIAATGKKRITGITDSGKTLQVTVLFAKGESTVTLRGYAGRPVTADKGKLSFDKTSHLFTVSLPAPANGNNVTVTLR